MHMDDARAMRRVINDGVASRQNQRGGTGAASGLADARNRGPALPRFDKDLVQRIFCLQQSDGRLRARNGRVRDSMLTLLSLRTLQRGERMLATYRGALRQAHDAMIGTSACARA